MTVGAAVDGMVSATATRSQRLVHPVFMSVRPPVPVRRLEWPSDSALSTEHRRGLLRAGGPRQVAREEGQEHGAVHERGVAHGGGSAAGGAHGARASTAGGAMPSVVAVRLAVRLAVRPTPRVVHGSARR